MAPWRHLSYHVGRSDCHFALSDALVRLAHTPTIWWHATRQPTLILGPTQGHFDIAACQQAGILVVQRQAGGTAVYAEGGVLGLDIVVPSGHELASTDILEAYRWLGTVWATSLQSFGIPARPVDIEEARSASRTRGTERVIQMACFGSLSPYEVVVSGRKLVGLAQVRRRAGVLFQSAIHLRFDAQRLGGLLPSVSTPDIVKELREVAVGLEEVSPRPITECDVMCAFEHSLRNIVGAQIEVGAWTVEELRYAGYEALPPTASAADPLTQ